MTARAFLRQLTREAHERVDQAFAGYDLADPEQYRRFLLDHARCVPTLESALTRSGAEDLVPDWSERLRGDLLLADLADLGEAAPEPCAPPAYASAAEVIGGAYVLEGSRLGAKMLLPAVPASLPRAFLGSAQPRGRWRAFLATLESELQCDKARVVAGEAAMRTFACFQPGIPVE